MVDAEDNDDDKSNRANVKLNLSPQSNNDTINAKDKITKDKETNDKFTKQGIPK